MRTVNKGKVYFKSLLDHLRKRILGELLSQFYKPPKPGLPQMANTDSHPSCTLSSINDDMFLPAHLL